MGKRKSSTVIHKAIAAITIYNNIAAKMCWGSSFIWSSNIYELGSARKREDAEMLNGQKIQKLNSM